MKRKVKPPQTDHEQEFAQLTKGFHQMIQQKQVKNTATMVQNLHAQIESRSKESQRMAQLLDRKIATLNHLMTSFRVMEKRMAHLQEKVESAKALELEKKLATLEKSHTQIRATGKRLATLEQAITKIDTLSHKHASLEKRITALKRPYAARLHARLNERLDVLEKGMNTLQHSTAVTDLRKQAAGLRKQLVSLKKKTATLPTSKAVGLSIEQAEENHLKKLHHLEMKLGVLEKHSLRFTDSRIMDQKLTGLQETLSSRLAKLDTRLTSVERVRHKPLTLSGVEKQLASLEQEQLSLAKNLRKLQSLPDELSRTREREAAHLHTLTTRLDSAEKNLHHLKHTVPRSLEHTRTAWERKLPTAAIRTLQEQTQSLGKRIREIEQKNTQQQLDDLHQHMRQLRRVLAKVEKSAHPADPLIKQLHTLERDLTTLTKETKKPLEETGRKIARIRKQLQSFADTAELDERVQKEKRDVHHLRTTMERKLASLERAMTAKIPGDLEVTLKTLNKRLASLEGLELGSRLSKVDDALSLTERSGHADRKREALVRHLSLLKEKQEKEIRLFKQDLAALKKPIPPQAPKPLLKKVSSLEKRLTDLGRRFQRQSREMKESLVPTERLDDMESRLSSPLEETQAAEKALAKDLHRLSRKVDGMDHHLKGKVDRDDVTMLHKRMSALDSLLQKKINSRFVASLENLEASIQDQFKAQRHAFEEHEHEMNKLKKDFAKKKDMHRVEEGLIRPIAAMDKKMKALIKKEAEILEKKIRKTASMEKLDAKTLQQEIDKIVHELENRRTRSLEDELSDIVVASEKLKKKRFKEVS